MFVSVLLFSVNAVCVGSLDILDTSVECVVSFSLTELYVTPVSIVVLVLAVTPGSLVYPCVTEVVPK